MNVAVVGLWHLGTVTAACLASYGHDVTAADDAGVAASLRGGVPPLFEPGLQALLESGLSSGRLRFTENVASAVTGAEIVWVTYDTPVDDDDRADVEHVVERIFALLPHLADGALVLISSQLPVGTTRRIELRWRAEAAERRVGFAYLPENLRLGTAIESFTRPDRVVAGVRAAADREKISALLQPMTTRIEWTSVESAEMIKHALNAFLATSVAFINEVATLCEAVGADAGEVERGLKTDSRIGERAYLSPGAAFAGGTLVRDVVFLSRLSESHGLRAELLPSVKSSNDRHRHWTRRRLVELLGGVAGKTVTVWGLTYKPGTDTLRRSGAVELCRWLLAEGATVQVHDPAVRSLPPELGAAVQPAASAAAAADGASALVLATSWPEYLHVGVADVAGRMRRRLVVDPGAFLRETFGRHSDIEYVTVGRASR